jgi:hypothetical protein
LQRLLNTSDWKRQVLPAVKILRNVVVTFVGEGFGTYGRLAALSILSISALQEKHTCLAHGMDVLWSKLSVSAANHGRSGLNVDNQAVRTLSATNKAFPSELEAKPFAKAMLIDGLRVTRADSLGRHEPT